MSKVQKAKELVNKASELRASKTKFLLEFAGPIREEFQKIKSDLTLNVYGMFDKISEVKERETKRFMREIALRKQAYQHYLNKAKMLAKETIEDNFISSDDATRAKFYRDFSELKFRIALMDEKAAFNDVKSFVDKAPSKEYATLLTENFHELAGKFNSGELKLALLKTFDQLKADSTPEEVAEAFEVIEQVDSSINNKMFLIMMPGDNPAANPDYSIISELFTQDAVRYYQEPEKYFEKQEGEEMPLFVDPEEVVEKQKSKVDAAYDSLTAILEQKVRDGELKL